MNDSSSKGLSRSAQAAKEGKDCAAPAGDRRGPEIVELDGLIAADESERAAVAARARAARRTTGTSRSESITTSSSLGRHSRRKKSKPNLPPKIHEKLVQDAIVFADALRRDYAETIKTDLSGFRSDLLRVLTGLFPLKRGRPRDPRLDAASRRLHQGEPDRDILRSEFPHFDTMQVFEQDLLVRGLHQAANRRQPKPRKSTRIKSRKKARDKQSGIPPHDRPVN